MTTHRLNSFILSSVVAGCLIAPAALSGQTNQTTIVVLDVATDAGTLAYARPDAVTTGVHAGDSYVISGFVYGGFSIPYGDTTDTFAPDPAGSIGTIAMTGIFADDGSDGNAPTISSTHVFSLVNANGLVTQGLEGASPVFRALLGGTGVYSGAIGQVTEEILGTNGTGGYNLRFTFQLVTLNPVDNSASQAAQLSNARLQKAKHLKSKH
jgi:hypothetical protein